MVNIIVVLPKLEEAKTIKNILIRSGFQVTGVCVTGAQAIQHTDGLADGVVICGYKMSDMLFSELKECLPFGFELLLLASQKEQNVIKERTAQENVMIAEAKEILMVRNHMTEGEAHKYLQKSSMDSGVSLTESAQMVLTMMKQ